VRSPSRIRRLGALSFIAASVLLTTRAEAASDPDPWFGRDKVLHFSATALIAGGTYALAATQFDARYPPLLLGAGAGIAVGAAKEIADGLGYGDPSWKDFAWDVLGTVAGLTLAWAVDLAVRGVSHEHPLFAAPYADAATNGSRATWRGLPGGLTFHW